MDTQWPLRQLLQLRALPESLKSQRSLGLIWVYLTGIKGDEFEGVRQVRGKTMFLFLFLYSKAPIPQASTDKKKIIQHAVFVFKHSLDELKYWSFPDVFSLCFEQWFLFLGKILVTQHGKRQKDKFFLHTHPFEVWRNSLHFKKKKRKKQKIFSEGRGFSEGEVGRK